MNIEYSIANIREQDSWVHQDDPEAATRKAIDIIRSMLAKVSLNEALVPLTLPLVKRALVVGGGIAGLVAALDIAEAGYPVLLVERSSSLGGNVARLSGLYLNLDPAADLLRGVIEVVTAHPNIEVLADTVVDSAGGYVGNFTVTLRPAHEDAVPSGGDQAGQASREHDVGAIILATGYELYGKEQMPEYGGGRCPDVIDGLEFERMLRPDGPTGRGKVTVTFMPSGRATGANVSGGGFGGTSVGGCVASVFRRAKVPPFSGSPVTVAKSFSIAK